MSAAPTVTPVASEGLAQQVRSIDASAAIHLIGQALSNPTAHSGLALLLVAALAILVVLVVLGVLIALTPARKKVVRVRTYKKRPNGSASPPPETAPPPEADRPEWLNRSRAVVATPAFAAALLVLVVLVGYIGTSTDRYCAETCHRDADATTSALEQGHARCASCHEVAGVMGVLPNTAARARMLVNYSQGATPEVVLRPVDSDECLWCHEDVAHQTIETERGILMSHKEVVTEGLPCQTCHDAAGHDPDGFTGSMSSCVVCHDGDTAATECSTCHARDPGAAAIAASADQQARGVSGTGRITYPAVRAAKRECGGCHDQETQCDYCHGLRMPHSAEFKQGLHARTAAFERKGVCWTCHDPQWCSLGGCHRGSSFNPADGTAGHAAGWKAQHSRTRWDSGCICHSRTSRTEPMCTLCHASDGSLLPPIQ